MAKTQGENCYKCGGNMDGSYISELDPVFLTVEMGKILEKKYIDNFMTALRSNICCDNVCFKNIIVNFFDDKVLTIINKKKPNFTVADVERHLQAYKEFAEEENVRNPTPAMAPFVIQTVKAKPAPAKTIAKKHKGKKNKNNQDW